MDSFNKMLKLFLIIMLRWLYTMYKHVKGLKDNWSLPIQVYNTEIIRSEAKFGYRLNKQFQHIRSHTTTKPSKNQAKGHDPYSKAFII